MVSEKVPNIRRTLSLASHFLLVSKIKPNKCASSIRHVTVFLFNINWGRGQIVILVMIWDKFTQKIFDCSNVFWPELSEFQGKIEKKTVNF